MAIRNYKPTSPARRFYSVQTFDEITSTTPHKPLVEPSASRTGGRNNTGELTSWWRGGGHKRAYRIIDFKRDKFDIPGKVATVEYDPNRSGEHRADQLCGWREALHPASARSQGGRHDVVGATADILPGNCLPLKLIPLGTMIHNVELKPGKGGQIARSAGSACSWWPRTASMRR
jgi:large subunit ribosomal protein L2